MIQFLKRIENVEASDMKSKSGRPVDPFNTVPQGFASTTPSFVVVPADVSGRLRVEFYRSP